jgi:hypothetical protein
VRPSALTTVGTLLNAPYQLSLAFRPDSHFDVGQFPQFAEFFQFFSRREGKGRLPRLYSPLS